MTNEFDCDVAVVGGSLVGSAAAMFLAQQGLTVVVIERRATASDHPRARGLSVRTMELFRSAGIESAIRGAGDDDFSFVVGDTLVDDHAAAPRPDVEAMRRLSPTTPYSCDQNRVEPILRGRAAELGATMRSGCTAVGVEHDAAGVTVNLSRSAEVDEPGRITARYLIAADGANGTLRDTLGIGRHGQDIPGVGLSALFDADLAAALRGRRVGGLVSPRRGTLLFPKGKAREHHWIGLVPRADLEDVDPIELDEFATAAIRAVVGDPELAVTLRSVLAWRTGAYVADRYRRGRVFLAGDAAHVMPPYGGFGGNTGIADVHNLAWRLAAVCAGAAPDALLESYERERKPIAEFTVGHVANRGFNFEPTRSDSPEARLNPVEISLGYCYPSRHLNPGSRPVRDPATSDGTPGMRVPHVSLVGESPSTLDLLDPTAFTFLTTDVGPLAVSLRHKPVTGVRLRTVSRREVDDLVTFDRVFGEPSVGLLVRPDGIVGWRTHGLLSDPSTAVARAYEECLSGG